jgi:predicted helicase
MNIALYIDTINKRYTLGNATEHTFRGDLQQLIESLVPTIRATNEPKRQACGAPDYILTKKDIPIGFIEAKDIGDKDLEGAKKTGNKEQFDRYKASLNNLIFTDYLDFHLYRDGKFVMKVAIAELTDKGIQPITQNFNTFTNLITDFCSHIGQTITNSKKLAEMMASKARLLAEIIEKAVSNDEDKQEDSTLKDQLTAFKEILIHDITPKGFADVYAQTIVYGMFAARYHDPTLPTFSRQEAYELIPKSNPFLKKLFGYIAGLDVDDRIKWIVDDLINIFLACNVQEMLKNYGKSTQMEDPIIHFYEDFLSEYDPQLRKARGVWYTPAPVVNFIVRAVDDILKTEFELPQGLADTSKTNIKILQKGKEIEQEVHRVQILDPATGTGTFLAEVVKHIYQKFKGQEGLWSNYVATNLLPRLNGFELLMASYAMAHLKMDLLLTETGYQPTTNQRCRIFLTNSLEESHPDTGTLFAQWLSNEANEANQIKRETPVMCVIGNPPYSGESANKGEWIMQLMEDYKKEPEGKQKLQEKNPKWINDDYVKFLRYGQYFIEKNGSGVLAFINPHGFLDNPTFRGMRWNLLKTYDKIYTIDLHGNSKKKETAPDGSVDENVFDIMQGVSINIFVKTGKKKAHELGKVFHVDLFGKREVKYDFLAKNSLKTVPYKELPNIAPNYYFVSKDFDEQNSYNKGFSINELLTQNSVGIVTARDEFTIHYTKIALQNTIESFLSLDDEVGRAKFNLGKDVRDWQVKFAKKDLLTHYPHKGHFIKLNYRPFDNRWTFYTGNSKGFHCYPRTEVMQHFLNRENLGLVTVRRIKTGTNIGFFISDKMVDDAYSGMSSSVVCPLYLYPEINRETRLLEDKKKALELKLEEAKSKLEGFLSAVTPIRKLVESMPNPDKELKKIYDSQTKELQSLQKEVEKYSVQLQPAQAVNHLFGEETRTPNLNKEIVKQIAEQLGLTFTNEKENKANTFAPVDILDYIYAVLHSPTYREKYKEFLKIDFPRVPYPKDAATFWAFVHLGSQLRQIHLLESPIVEQYITQYPIDGDNTVSKVKYQDGKVYINDTQYFDNVSHVAWEFYIGGYQPAQKWLKDRKERQLEFEDIFHYQKIIVALTETDKLMKEIDKIDFE